MKSVKQIERVYYLVVGLFWLATALPLALIVLIHQSRGLDLFQVGLLMGAYSLTIVLLEIPTGGLADAIGRKRVALLSYTVTLLAGAIFFLAFAFPAFLLAWILSGVGRALSSGAMDAWFIDSLQEVDPEIDIQPSLARAGTITLLALGAGTLLGGLLPRLFKGLPDEGTAALTPLTTTLLLSAFLMAVLIVIVALLVHEKRTDQVAGAWRDGFRQVPVIVGDALNLSRRNPTVVLLLAIAVASGLGLASVETFWQPFFAGLSEQEGEVNSLFFGALMALSFLLGAAGNMASIPLGRLLKGRYGLLAAIIQGSMGLALIVLAFQNNVLPAALFFWLVYFGMGAINSPNATLINAEIPAERRSSMLSVQSLATYLGVILGSAGLGYVAKNVSISLAWIVAGTVLLVSLLLYWQVDARRTGQEQSYDAEAAIL